MYNVVHKYPDGISNMRGLSPAGSPRNVRGSRGRVTLQIIANQLSVSTATVSLALRDSPVVAEITKRNVQRLARELGYMVSRSPSLRVSQGRMIAVAAGDLASPGNIQIVSAIEETSRLSGRTIMISPQLAESNARSTAFAALRDQKPDGIIVKLDHPGDQTDIDGLVSIATPTVLIGACLEDSNFDCVGFDLHRAASLAAMHLQGLGHDRIALVAGCPPVKQDALIDVYQQAFDKFGLILDKTLVHMGSNDRETGIRAVENLVSISAPPTAAICTDDLIALGAMSGLRRLGMEAGRNFSLIGCGNIPEAAHAFPGLTTIGVRYDDIGRIAADLLFKRIDDPDGKREHVVLDPVLVVRSTTASLAGH